MYGNLGDFKSNKNHPDWVPTYTVTSASDIVTLPDTKHPIFDFVKVGNEVYLANYHFYGGRIKDANGNTAINPGVSLTDYSDPATSKNPNYVSEYLPLLSNGHFRAEIPVQVKFNGVLKNVTKIGKSALSIQTNEGSMVPYNSTKGTELTDYSSCKYWQENQNFWTMREITLPNTITTIEDASMAFIPFTTLKTYSATDSKDSIGEVSKIWNGTSGLSNNGVFPSSLTSIGRLACAFSGITHASLPDKLTNYGGIDKNTTSLSENFYSFPFIGCFDLIELSIYNSGAASPTFYTNTDGGIISFTNKNGTKWMIEGAEGTSSLEIGWGTTSIANGALRGGRQIQSVSFPYTTTKIPNYLMDTIGASIDSQGWNSYSILDTVTFASAEECGENATQRQQHPVPECTEIGESAFSGCASLRNVELPKNLRTLGPKVFWNCANLGKHVLQNDTGITVDNGTADTSPYTPIPNTNMGNDLDLTQIPSLTSMGSQCFSDCTSLNSVTTSSSIGTLAANTFYNCSGLTSATFDDQTKSFGASCFENCTSLGSVTLPSGSNLGASCFKNCSAMTSATFTGGQNTINGSCFNSCRNLSSVTFAPTAYATFENNAFDSCTALTNIYIPSGSTVKNNVFKSCTGLDDNHSTGEGVVVGAGVTFTGQASSGAFWSCGKDTVIYLEDSESTYTSAQKDNGNIKARYPTGWNFYKNGTALRVYTLCEGAADVPGNIPHWRYVAGVPTPW